ncbi:hypothetical protein [Psychrosphaera haliotis]|uniref:Lipoprotein n=1 Tax=Psychrosphaera haliotis TaxID=555083 RepID=A0A6N8F9F8_9GAMM|nr:hypothetical protein [Psychrosphaera haliotis]MUH71161.1 hypothetical protein [Psychrosphaera haliotis]
MKNSVLIALVCGLAACSATSNTTNDVVSEQTVSFVNVYKDANKKQCFSQGMALNVMVKELTENGIVVNCSARKNDGLMYPQACGQNEGTINVYQISSSDFEKAQLLGFKDVKEIKSADIKLKCP